MNSIAANRFSVKRSLYYLKEFLQIHRNMFWVGAISLITIALLFQFFLIWIQPAEHMTESGNMVVFFTMAGQIYDLIGYGLTSVLFMGMHKSVSNTRFLTLPVKTSEKLFAAGMMSFICYSIVAYGILLGFTFSIGSNWGQFVGEVAWPGFQTYIVGQSVFLFGAVFFRKNHFITTLAIVLGMLLVFILISNFLLQAEVANTGKIPSWAMQNWNNSGPQTFLNFSIAAIFLMLSYFRLKNYEVA